ncbi:SLAM family member 8-like isoform X1 [Onychostoma macrolepis]|uniref:SLAM family member 8-like isoform X1 n=1 Tax=Onychostoma macrolepis TaxID=369639 RepID=UPI00272B5B7E|nr:SLAM family member 8-like isoform X1 [Onychostoma macrolepis]
MNVFQESCCSILVVLLVFLVQGSCVDSDAEVLHKAVGDSLELTADYPKDDLEVQWKYNGNIFAEYQKKYFKTVEPELFHGRLKMNEGNISITVADLKLQDSGSFSIVAEGKSTQYKTKFIELRVHDLIREVKIEYNVSWLQSQNICTFHLWCLESGDQNPSYSWTGHQIQTQGSHLNISLRPAENTTLNCTADNTVSIKYTTETVVCTETSKTPSMSSGFPQKYLLIAVGVGIVAVVIFGGALAVCCRRRNNKGQGESEAGITVYEDVNTDATAKKRSESVTNGMSIYETVNDIKPSQGLPQTLYDKISYQRHPAVSPSTSSPYQDVL